MSFGPALALGIRSVAEYVDIKLVRAVDAEELIERLNDVSPRGLRFLRARRLDATEPKLSKALAAQDLLLAASTEWLNVDPDGPSLRERITERCAAILGQASLPVERVRKGKARTIDLRPAILELYVVDQTQWAPELGLTPSLGVKVRLKAESSGPTPKPKELAALVFGGELSHAGMARVACWARGEEEGFQDPLAHPRE